MSHIKPTGGPGATGPLGPSDAPTAPASPVATGTSATPAAASPTDAVVAALRERRITPDEAVRQLTDIALHRAGVPASARPQVESRMRALLGSDPTLGGLLRRMDASIPEE